MKSILISLAAAGIVSLHFAAAQVTVLGVIGDVRVRHDVGQDWQRTAVGDVLRPEDSMRSGGRASATILVNGKKRITIPENVIVDLADFRSLTQEELLLKLAMERIRSLPTHEGSKELIIPQTTVVHGPEKGPDRPLSRDIEPGMLQLNGTQVLYRNGYYATCALKAKEIFRLYPELARTVDLRLMVASALEKENLHGEALIEYTSLVQQDLSPTDKALVQERMMQLKKKEGEKIRTP